MKKSKKSKFRPMGDVLLDMEPLMDEFCDAGLQWGDVLALVHAYLMVHRPDAKEKYLDDSSSPVFYYGPKEGLK